MRPPPLSHVLYYPVTAHCAAAALSLTLAKLAGVDVSFLYTDYQTWPSQPWRLLTSALPHGNPLHLIFNLYMFWMFGSVIEPKLGSLQTLALYLVLAFGSSAAEFAVFDGGIGLSGVVYGQFGLIWLLNRRDARFGQPADVIDKNTASWLVFWFFLCIVLTLAKVMPVANVAHGVGALLGYMIAWAMSARTRSLRLRWWAALIGVLALFTAASWWGEPYINLSPRREAELSYYGYEALREKRFEEAVHLLRRAARINSREPTTWRNLGVAYHHLGRPEERDAAWARERELNPNQLDASETGKN